MAINLKSLVQRLDPVCRRTLEGAAGLCLSRTHYNVEVEHWLTKLCETTDTDLALILNQLDVDISRLNADLTRTLDGFKTGNSRPPALSPNVVELAREAWLVASLEYGAAHTRSGHVLIALVTDSSLSRLARDVSREFEKLGPEAVAGAFATVGGDSGENDGSATVAGAAAPAGAGGMPAAGGGTALAQYTIDLTARAAGGHIDPVLGRDGEIRQMIDILSRRRQNNPILTGEAGVGKTAVVEGFAQRIADGDVPPSLQGVAVHTLDLGLLQAGAGMKGEFENRLKSVIDEVKASAKPIIMFIDEAHTLIGAGGQAGQNDAANLLKPALARGELRTVAATTWAEYKKYFERDAALARRFQVVKVEEPSEESAIEMMRGLSKTMQSHHGVRVLDEAIQASVRLSSRYITGRQLPDKSVSLIDTACARVAISHTATPAVIEDGRRGIEQLGVAIESLEREQDAGADHAERIGEMKTKRDGAQTALTQHEERWKRELELAREIRTLQDKLAGPLTPSGGARSAPATEAAGEAPAGDTSETPAPAGPVTDPGERTAIAGELETKRAELRELQGEEPLVQVSVDEQAIADVVSAWTGIPVGRMVADEIGTVLSLRERMEERIVGQSHALEEIAQTIRTGRANLTDPGRPIGVFMMAGPSGVGKTETAITLAELLYGGDQNMTVINMSEFKEEHKVSLLMGSPPGYVGYGEGGVLTEAVRRKPYSVVLLDEMEKAHPGVQDVFYQVFDKGMMKDGEGRDIDFKNTVIIITSNLGTDTIVSMCEDPETTPDPEGLAKAIRNDLLGYFKPAFLGRLSVVPYFPLSDEVMRKIIRLKLGKVERRVRDNYKATFGYTPAVVEAIAERCQEVHTGARNVDHILSRTLLPELAAEFLGRMAEGGVIAQVQVDVESGGGFDYALS